MRKRFAVRVMMLYLLLVACVTGCNSKDENVLKADDSSENNDVENNNIEENENKIEEDDGDGNEEENSTHKEEAEMTPLDRLFVNGTLPVQDENGLWGYIDKSADYVIDPAFSEARSFMGNGLALVRDEENQLWGMIDVSGDYVVEPIFVDIGNYFESERLAAYDGYLWGYIDPSGEYVIEPQFGMVYDFSEGLAAVKDRWGMGFINPSGEYVIEPFYTQVSNFSNGRAFVDVWVGEEMYCALIDKEGNVLTGPIGRFEDTVYYSDSSTSNQIRYSWDSGLCKITSTDGSDVWINTSGEVVLPKPDQSYSYCSAFQEGLAFVRDENNDGGWIDPEGNWVIPPEKGRNGTSFFRSGYAFVFGGGSYLFDKSGNCVLEFAPNIQPAHFVGLDRIAVALRTEEGGYSKLGFCDLDGNIVVDYLYDEIGAWESNGAYIEVKYEGLWGIVDKDGNWLVPAKFYGV